MVRGAFLMTDDEISVLIRGLLEIRDIPLQEDVIEKIRKIAVDALRVVPDSKWEQLTKQANGIR